MARSARHISRSNPAARVLRAIRRRASCASSKAGRRNPDRRRCASPIRSASKSAVGPRPMTHSVIDLPVHADDRRIARLAALAIGLTLAEAALPSPVPGVKPGLANIVILLVLLQYGWRAAAWVSGLRVLADSQKPGANRLPSSRPPAR